MKEASRKYIDLIYEATSKYANWDPPKVHRVGDYGTVNSKGEFEKAGNIYDESDALDIGELLKKNPPIDAPPMNSYVTASKTVRYRELGAELQAQVIGLAEASIKGRWEFGRKRGALLLMDHPRTTYIPPKMILRHLVKLPLFKSGDFSLITEVIRCPCYSLYLSSGKNDCVSLALLGAPPLPVAPGLQVGAGGSFTWWTADASGLLHDACDPTGSYSYHPLYSLASVRKPGLLTRDSPVPEPESDDLWMPAPLPWGPLDEDGEEQEFEDTVYDD